MKSESYINGGMSEKELRELKKLENESLSELARRANSKNIEEK